MPWYIGDDPGLAQVLVQDEGLRAVLVRALQRCLIDNPQTAVGLMGSGTGALDDELVLGDGAEHRVEHVLVDEPERVAGDIALEP